MKSRYEDRVRAFAHALPMMDLASTCAIEVVASLIETIVDEERARLRMLEEIARSR